MVGEGNCILGVDIGATSIGWALVEEVSNRVVDCGVRIFEPGVEGDEQSIASGREESRAKKRRVARQIRRQIWRRAHRKRKLMNLLQHCGLLPQGEINDVIERIVGRYLPPKDDPRRRQTAHVVPYLLRKKALDERLAPDELGYVFYHLCQRRGFKSIRKSPQAQDEKEGKKVQAGITELERRMREADARTLGEYFSMLYPEQERIRNRYTSRRMYEEEFNLIWEAQRCYYPDILTDDLKEKIYEAMFYQRPLKSQAHLIGRCSLEPEERRAPWPLLICQRFRFLQRLNDTKVIEPNGSIRPFSPQERDKLIPELDTKGQLTFKQVRKILGFSDDYDFQSADEKKLIGNKTAAAIIKAIGKKLWEAFSSKQKEQLVSDLTRYDDEVDLKTHLMDAYGLNEQAAQNLAKVNLEQGYCAHSVKALKKLLPIMEQGTSYATAKKEAYPHAGELPVYDLLPPVLDTNPNADAKSGLTIRNPVVTRALAELRKVVNAIIKRYGKPSIIRVELARDLKRSKDIRVKRHKRILENEARRKAAEEKLKKWGLQNPSRDDVTKFLLAEECNWQCPYTGKQISMETLFGATPEFQVEHIIPFSRSLDNSFANKTLCHVSENKRKGNRTPFEAYHGTPLWDEIIHRVRKFKGPFAKAKLELFQKKEIEEDFAHRQLNDTAYAAREAAKYLALLYGGRIGKDGRLRDKHGRLRVQVSTGQVTAHIRRVLGLNTILGDDWGKNRQDHRHHAVDAIAIALSSPAMVRKLSIASQKARNEGVRSRYFRLFAPIAPPSPTFLDDVRRAINNIVVSHRVSRKVQGPLHEETFYSPPRDENGRISPDGKFVHIRKPLDQLSAKDVEGKFVTVGGKRVRLGIIDDDIRRRVKDKLTQLGETDPKKAFKDLANLPTDHRGRKIKRVRIRLHLEAIERIGNRPGEPFGKGRRERFVIPGSNHHMEIFEFIDKHGNPVWDGYVVTRLQAMRRLKNKQPIIQRTPPQQMLKEHQKKGHTFKRFVFSLAHGEIIQLSGQTKRGIKPYKGDGLYRVTTVPQSKQLVFKHINDAEPAARKEGEKTRVERKGRTAYPETLRELNCRKVVVTPLGEVRRAND